MGLARRRLPTLGTQPYNQLIFVSRNSRKNPLKLGELLKQQLAFFIASNIRDRYSQQRMIETSHISLVLCWKENKVIDLNR